MTFDEAFMIQQALCGTVCGLIFVWAILNQ